jgi:hypothetical protein
MEFAFRYSIGKQDYCSKFKTVTCIPVVFVFCCLSMVPAPNKGTVREPTTYGKLRSGE